MSNLNPGEEQIYSSETGYDFTNKLFNLNAVLSGSRLSQMTKTFDIPTSGYEVRMLSLLYAFIKISPIPIYRNGANYLKVFFIKSWNFVEGFQMGSNERIWS